MPATTNLGELIMQRVRNMLREVMPYTATVTALSAGKVKFRPNGVTTGADELYGRIAGFGLIVGDDIKVIGRRNPLVLGKIQRAAPTAPYVLDAGLTIGGHVDTSGSASGVAAGAAAGTTAVATFVGGNDTAGVLQLVPGGTGIATGVIFTITFAAARADANFHERFTPLSSAARTLGGVIGASARATGSVTISTNTALTSGATYIWGYDILGY
jgi:hypothetical protein